MVENDEIEIKVFFTEVLKKSRKKEIRFLPEK
jgi:hypothetical protein